MVSVTAGTTALTRPADPFQVLRAVDILQKMLPD